MRTCNVGTQMLVGVFANPEKTTPDGEGGDKIELYQLL